MIPDRLYVLVPKDTPPVPDTDHPMLPRAVQRVGTVEWAFQFGKGPMQRTAEFLQKIGGKTVRTSFSTRSLQDDLRPFRRYGKHRYFHVIFQGDDRMVMGISRYEWRRLRKKKWRVNK